jgi:hypothetical protein
MSNFPLLFVEEIDLGTLIKGHLTTSGKLVSGLSILSIDLFAFSPSATL